MYIKEIIQASREDNEAEILVSDGTYDILCYVNPIGLIFNEGHEIEVWGFMCNNIIRATINSSSVTKLQEYYAYTITGKVLSVEGGVIQLGKIAIHLDAKIPNDIENGEYVSVTVLRFDAL